MVELAELEAGVVVGLDIDGIGVVWCLCARVCKFNVNVRKFVNKKTVVFFQENSLYLEM